jgi:hypothetical protein
MSTGEEEIGSDFGISVGYAGNGDGQVMVGAPRWGLGRPSAGKVFVFCLDE